MSYLYRLAAFTIFFSFFFGLIWSIYLKRPQNQTHAYELRLLIPDHLETMGFSKSISNNSEILIQPVIFKSYKELEKLLETKVADVAIIPSPMSSRLIDLKLLQPLPTEISEKLSFIHVDFKHSSFDPHNRYTYPLFWGVNGLASNTETEVEDVALLPTEKLSLIDDFVQEQLFVTSKKEKTGLTFHSLTTESLQHAKDTASFVQIPVSYFPLFEALSSESPSTWTFQIPKNSGQLWILSLTMISSANTKAVIALMKYFFHQKFQDNFLQTNPIGVTYLTLQNLPETQHPSFLRTLPLKRLQLKELSKSLLIQEDKPEN